MRILNAHNFIRKMLSGAVLITAFCFAVAFSAFAEKTEQDDPSSMSGAWSFEADSNVSFGTPELQNVQDGITLDMSYGYRNLAKSGHKLPVHISIGNYEAEDISGRIIIETEGSIDTGSDSFEESINRYSFEAEAAAGEITSIEGVISVSEDVRDVSLLLVDMDNKLLAETKVPINISTDGSELLIGILSDSPDKLDFFNGINVSQTALRTRTIELDPENLPNNALELEQLDLIVISNLKSEHIKDGNIAAIEEWMENGGVLLVGTGEKPDVADLFGEYISDFFISIPKQLSVDMGLKYSKSGPDGATLLLDVCEILSSEGIQKIQTTDIPILTTINGVNGIIGFTAYDLCDISEFCSQEMGYTDELISSLFGSARINRLLNKTGTSMEKHENVSRFLGVSDPGRMPRVGVYIVFAALYLSFICWILYLWLRGRGLEYYYHSLVIIFAFTAAFIVWIFGASFRNNGLDVSYSVIREHHAGSVSESGFVRLFSAAVDGYELALPENYEIYPIVRKAESSSILSEENKKTDGLIQNDSGVMECRYDAESKSIHASGLGPFAGSVFEYASRNISEPEREITANIRFFGEKMAGKVINDSDYLLEDAAILLFGRIIKLGNIPSHTELNLSEYTPTVAPTTDPDAVAGFITGLNDVSPDSDNYYNVLRKTRFLSYYISESLESYYGGARLIGFDGSRDMFADVHSAKRFNKDGILLDVCIANSEFRSGNRIWRNGLSFEPVVISGDYDTVSNTSRGSAVIEFSLGTDVSVNSLYFTELAEEFYNDDLSAFSGQISLYNYITGNYEYIRAKREFTGAEIDPYLSPANTLMVRYLPDETVSSKKAVYLPVPNIIGSER